MKVVLFGASGMVGQGVLRECTHSPDVTEVLSIVRTATGSIDPKVTEVVHDLFDLAPLKPKLRGVDAVFFCLGVSAAGMTEEAYRRVTHDLTLSAARVIHDVSPQATFVYVSGSGTDPNSKTMWARIKGQTENDLLALFDKAYMFRPGLIRPKNGAVSKTRLYRASYIVMWPVLPLLQTLFPRAVTDTELVGKAMLAVAKKGSDKRIVESPDIDALARA